VLSTATRGALRPTARTGLAAQHIHREGVAGAQARAGFRKGITCVRGADLHARAIVGARTCVGRIGGGVASIGAHVCGRRGAVRITCDVNRCVAGVRSSTSIGIDAGIGAASARARRSSSRGSGGASCTGATFAGSTTDTYRVRIELPAGVGSILPLTSDFGKITLEKDAAGTITAVTWQKADADLLPSDSEYYKLLIRMRTPSAPFTTIYFPVIQTCKKPDGTLLTTRWVGKPGDLPLPDGGMEEPAGSLQLVPVRHPGWNKYTVPVAIPNNALAGWFANAIIVWKGNAAFSANPATTELIKTTAGVTALDSLQPNDEIWVRY
jgi:hypothetical protein